MRNYKKKEAVDKEREGVWSDNEYSVERIITSHSQKLYKLEGLTKEYMRHELLNVWNYDINLLVNLFNRLIFIYLNINVNLLPHVTRLKVLPGGGLINTKEHNFFLISACAL